MIKILFYVGVLFVLLVCYVRYLERTAIFFPEKDVRFDPSERELAFEDIYMTTPDGLKLHGWFIPRDQARATLLFFHGNAGNISDRLDKIRLFHHMGLNVLIIDYRGYGKSEGAPTEEGLRIDAQTAYDYVIARGDVDPRKIVIFGASLGGVVAAELAVKEKPAAIILDSCFTNAVDMAKRIYPFIPSFLLKVKLDVLSSVQRLSVPVLFIHSQEDETVPFELGQRLYQNAHEPKVFLEIAGSHTNGHLYDADKFGQGISQFLNDHHI